MTVPSAANKSRFYAKLMMQYQKVAFSYEIFAKYIFAWYLFRSQQVFSARTDRSIGSSEFEFNQNVETVTRQPV